MQWFKAGVSELHGIQSFADRPAFVTAAVADVDKRAPKGGSCACLVGYEPEKTAELDGVVEISDKD